MAHDQSNGTALAKAAVTSVTKASENETAIAAASAQAQALVQARYVMAFQRPRDWDDARLKLLKACQRPRFAETAIYAKPVGGQRIEGPSIRFAEEAARAMGNIDVQTPVLYDDAEKRIIGVRVTDLESNTNYSMDVTVQKTVERRKLKDGQQAKGTRLNSYGETVYLVEATDDDLLNKQNALVSKSIRTGILRVLPSDIREEALDAARETMERGDATDPDAARKKLASAFSAIGVSPLELKRYLGHELAACSPSQMADLRKVYAAIRDGEAKWSDFVTAKPADGEAPKSRAQAAKDAVKGRAKASEPEVDPETGEVIPDGVGAGRTREPGED